MQIPYYVVIYIQSARFYDILAVQANAIHDAVCSCAAGTVQARVADAWVPRPASSNTHL